MIISTIAVLFLGVYTSPRTTAQLLPALLEPPQHPLRFVPERQGHFAQTNLVAETECEQRRIKPLHNNCIISKTQKGGEIADCSYRGISSLAEVCLPHPETITVLNLTGNMIADIIDNAWAPFPRLEVLTLANNKLEKLQNDSFSGLDRLLILDLQGNHLAMTREIFPDLVFQPLRNLKTLFLNNNTNNVGISSRQGEGRGSLNYLDWALSQLTRLKHLYMDGIPDKSFGPGFGNMTSLRSLILSGYKGTCMLGTLHNNMFVHLRQITGLTMRRCNLRLHKIENNVLAPLTNLRSLDVARNVNLNIDGIIPLLHGLVNSTELRRLDISMMVNPYSRSRCVSNELAAALPRSLTYINAASNNLEMVSDRVFDLLPANLSYLTLNGNPFFFGGYLQNFSKMESLTTLKLNGWIKGYALPKYFSQDDQHLTSNCTIGKVSHKTPFIFKLPPKLARLEMNLASISVTVTNFTFDPNNSLESFSAMGNNMPYLEGPVTGLNKLRKLNLENNNIRYISSKFFESFGSLQSIILRNNVCGSSISRAGEGLTVPISLKYLDLSDISLSDVKIDFDRLPNLTKIVLKHCNMGSFTPDLSGAKNLRYLDLSNNSLFTLRHDITQAISNIPDLLVDISNNNIGCYCANLHFIKWLVHYPHLKKGNLLELACDYHDSIERIFDLRNKLTEMERECASNLVMLSILTSLCASVLLILCVFVAYRYRWKLRFWYYSAFLQLTSNQRGCPGDFESDVLVTYCKEDRDFAEVTINDALTELGLRVRIRGRHFKAGLFEFKNIVEAVQMCRRTLILLTPEMISDKWCMATINLASIEKQSSGRSVFLFLVLRPVDAASLGADLLFHIQSSKVRFAPPPEMWHDERAMNLFWKRLYRDLC